MDYYSFMGQAEQQVGGMKTGKFLKNPLLYWKTILLIAALGNTGYGGTYIFNLSKDMAENKGDWTYWAGFAFICFYVLVNVFAAVNVFFFDKLAVHIVLIIIYGFDAGLSGLILAVVGQDIPQNRSDYSTSNLIFFGFLVPVFVLSVFSALQLIWRLEKVEKGRT